MDDLLVEFAPEFVPEQSSATATSTKASLEMSDQRRLPFSAPIALKQAAAAIADIDDDETRKPLQDDLKVTIGLILAVSERLKEKLLTQQARAQKAASTERGREVGPQDADTQQRQQKSQAPPPCIVRKHLQQKGSNNRPNDRNPKNKKTGS